MWFSRPTGVSRAAWEQFPDSLMPLMSASQAKYLSLGSAISILRVLSVHPSTVCTSSGLPSATSFGSDGIGLLGTGSSLSPAWGRLVTCIASGTT